MITLDLMHEMWPHGNEKVPGLIEGIFKSLPEAFDKYKWLDTPLAMAHFLAQWSEECGAGTEMQENMNYSAHGLMQTWPTRFGLDRAEKFAHNPRMIAEAVYGGRMGNNEEGDGWKYRGAGLSQLTGKENYSKVGRHVGLDLVEKPDLALEPAHAVMIACADMIEVCSYKDMSCLDWAKADNIEGVTHALNGGLIGLSDREYWLRKWKHALGV
jgi:putative chitinase